MRARLPIRFADAGPGPTIGLMVASVVLVVLPVGRAKWGLAVALLVFAAMRAGRVTGLEATAATTGALVAAAAAGFGAPVALAYVIGVAALGGALVGLRVARDRGLLS